MLDSIHETPPTIPRMILILTTLDSFVVIINFQGLIGTISSCWFSDTHEIHEILGLKPFTSILGPRLKDSFL